MWRSQVSCLNNTQLRHPIDKLQEEINPYWVAQLGILQTRHRGNDHAETLQHASRVADRQQQPTTYSFIGPTVGYIVVRCNTRTLQHTATHCNTLQQHPQQRGGAETWHCVVHFPALHNQTEFATTTNMTQRLECTCLCIYTFSDIRVDAHVCARTGQI